jgi:hypothetical protein
MALITPTATRVEINTSDSVNERIRQSAERRLSEFEPRDTAAITQRLNELKREWDVERAIETEAPLMIAAGLGAGAWLDRRLTAVSAFAAGMLLLHNVQGWYPLLPVFRRAGLRTTREIADEAYELKSARGDFDDLATGGSPEDLAARAYATGTW